MKRILLLGLALLFVSGAVSAQQVAMYVDEARASWCVMDAMPYDFINIYLFINPPAEGAKCIDLSTVAEYGNYRVFAYEPNPGAQDPILGGFPDDDLAGCFAACQDTWNWLVRGEIMMLSADPVKIYFRPSQDPVQPNMWMLNCADPAEEVEALALTDFYVNSCGPVSVEESSWGAIKSLYE